MINSKNRFHTQGGINFVYRKGKTVRNSLMSLKFAPSKGEDYQLAVVVSKKVNKSAVVRNRIRRRIYEIIRLARKDVPNPWPYQMILSVHKDEPATLPAGELKKQVLNLLKKAGVI